MAGSDDDWGKDDKAAPTGEAYINTLPPQMQPIVRGLLAGNLPVGVKAITSKEAMPYVRAAMMADPTFSAATFPARAEQVKQLASMKSEGGYLTSVAALIHHGSELEGAIKKVGNPSGLFGSWGGAEGNYWLHKNQPEFAAYNAINQNYGNELAKVLVQSPGGTGSGGGAQGDREEAKGVVAGNLPQDSQYAAIAANARLAYDKLQGVNQGYRRTMNGDIPGIISPEEASILLHQMRLRGDGTEGDIPQGLEPWFLNLAKGGSSNSSGGQPPSGGAAPTADSAPVIPGQPGGGLAAGLQGGSYGTGTVGTAAQGTQSIPNERYRAYLAGINNLFAKGASDDEIRTYSQQMGGYSNVDPLLAYRRSNPGFKGPFPGDPNGMFAQAPNTTMGQVAGALANSPTATFAGEFGNAALAGIPQAAVAGLSASPEATRQNFNLARNVNPSAATWGNILGTGAGAAAFEGLAAKGAGNLVSRGLLSADQAAVYAPRVADATFGAVGGATSNPDAPVEGAVKGGAVGLLGGMAGRGVARGVAGVLAPTGGDVANLYAAGVRPTLGQRFVNSGATGKIVNATEEGLQSYPVFGGLIKGARDRARDQFQTGAFNDALSHIDTQLPADVTKGTAAHAYMQDAFGNAYDDVLPRMTARADPQAIADTQAVVKSANNGGLAEGSANRFNQIIQDTVQRRMVGPDLAGDNLKSALSDLGAKVRQIRNNPQGDSELADHLQDYMNAIKDSAFRNSNPEDAARLNAIDTGYAKGVVIENASRKPGGEIAEFTPIQFKNAVQQSSGGTRSRQFLRGDALMQDYANSGMNLADRLPNSGSAERLMLGQGIAAGPVGALGYASPKAAIGAGLLTLPYAPGIRNATTALLAPRQAPVINTLGDLLRSNTAMQIGSGVGVGSTVPGLIQGN